MKVIAITGGIGSGKSVCLREFERLGAHIISCDEISHRIMMRGGSAYEEVLERFGNEILGKDNEIDRAALAEIVFSDRNKLEELNSITHRLIFEEINKNINETAAGIICIEIPLLFTIESPIDIDFKIAVIAPRETRINRAMVRDGASREKIEARIKNQITDEEMQRLADYVIENDGNFDTLSKRVEKIFEEIVRD